MTHCSLCGMKFTPSDVCEKCTVKTEAGEVTSLKREIAEMKSRLSAYEKVCEWRDIEDAPKDGFHLLLYRPEIVFAGYWSDAGWVIKAPGLPIMEPPPTMWMREPSHPLPPTQEGEV